jgi:hypothetical protein
MASAFGGGCTEALSETPETPEDPEAPPETPPDPLILTLPAAAMIEPGATITSDPVTLSGLEEGGSFHVAGAGVSVNGGGFAGTATVLPGDVIRLRATAPSGNEVSTTLSGGISGLLEIGWTITTHPAGFRFEQNIFTAQTGAFPGLSHWNGSVTRKAYSNPQTVSVWSSQAIIWRSDTGAVQSYFADINTLNPTLWQFVVPNAWPYDYEIHPGIYSAGIIDDANGDIYFGLDKVSRGTVARFNRNGVWTGDVAYLGFAVAPADGRVLHTGFGDFLVVCGLNNGVARVLTLNKPLTANWFGNFDGGTPPAIIPHSTANFGYNVTPVDFAIDPATGGGWALLRDHYSSGAGIVPINADGTFGAVTQLTMLPSNGITSTGLVYDAPSDRLIILTDLGVYKFTRGMSLESSNTSLPHNGQAGGSTSAMPNTQDTSYGTVWFYYTNWLSKFDVSTMTVTGSWNILTLSGGAIGTNGLFRDPDTGAFWTADSGMSRFWVE